MASVAQMLVNFVYYLLLALQAAMLMRAVLSWIAPDAEGVLPAFLEAVTEPFIAAVRTVLWRLHISDDGPINLSFLLTVIIFSVLQVIFFVLI